MHPPTGDGILWWCLSISFLPHCPEEAWQSSVPGVWHVLSGVYGHGPCVEWPCFLKPEAAWQKCSVVYPLIYPAFWGVLQPFTFHPPRKLTPSPLAASPSLSDNRFCFCFSRVFYKLQCIFWLTFSCCTLKTMPHFLTLLESFCHFLVSWAGFLLPLAELRCLFLAVRVCP